MKHSLQLRLSQHLTLTPQLQQSIRLLQLSTLELNQELERFLQENPLLERDEGAADAIPAAPGLNGSAAEEGVDQDVDGGVRGEPDRKSPGGHTAAGWFRLGSSGNDRSDAAMAEQEAQEEIAMAQAKADYEIAMERCDALEGDAHDNCEQMAEQQYESAKAEASRFAATDDE